MRAALRPALYLLLLVFAGFCVHLLQRDLAQLPAFDLARQGGAVLLCGLLSLFNYGLRIVRWRQFMSRLGHDIGFGRHALYYLAGFAFTLSPGKLGELARAGYYQRHGVPAATVTAAFFVERLLDLLAVLALAVVGLAAFAGADGYAPVLWLSGGLLAVAVGVTAWVPWVRVEAHCRARGGLAGRVVTPVAHTLLQARALLAPGILFSAALLGLLAWGAEGIGLGVLSAVSPEPALDWAAGVGVYSLAVLAGAISFLPGGLGSTEAVMIALLHAWGLPLGGAVLITLLCRLLTLWLAVAIGWLCVLYLRLRRS